MVQREDPALCLRDICTITLHILTRTRLTMQQLQVQRERPPRRCMEALEDPEPHRLLLLLQQLRLKHLE